MCAYFQKDAKFGRNSEKPQEWATILLPAITSLREKLTLRLYIYKLEDRICKHKTTEAKKRARGEVAEKQRQWNKICNKTKVKTEKQRKEKFKKRNKYKKINTHSGQWCRRSCCCEHDGNVGCKWCLFRSALHCFCCAFDAKNCSVGFDSQTSGSEFQEKCQQKKTNGVATCYFSGRRTRLALSTFSLTVFCRELLKKTGHTFRFSSTNFPFNFSHAIKAEAVHFLKGNRKPNKVEKVAWAASFWLELRYPVGCVVQY